MTEILECILWGGYFVMAGYFWRVIETAIEETKNERKTAA